MEKFIGKIYEYIGGGASPLQEIPHPPQGKELNKSSLFSSTYFSRPTFRIYTIWRKIGATNISVDANFMLYALFVYILEKVNP